MANIDADPTSRRLISAADVLGLANEPPCRSKVGCTLAGALAAADLNAARVLPVFQSVGLGRGFTVALALTAITIPIWQCLACAQ